MPNYLYEDIRTGKIYEVFQKMNEKHEAFSKDGFKLKRVFINPQIAIDAFKIDPYKPSDFIKATAKCGKYGDVLDRSKELSLKRADKEGRDPIQEKYYKNWTKRRRGIDHPDIQQRKTKEVLEKGGFIVDSLDIDE